MATVLIRSILVSILTIYVFADEIELEASSGTVLKMLREMVNETNADSLNLPANASSIRENITDTFSCESRVYGYYADVDNDCQIFHVCLPSQTPSGRNVTYRWSFICPSETVFNQEVLVCTRPRDSIPCEDSPGYYDLNMEIGKIAEDKKEPDNQVEPSPVGNNAEATPQASEPSKESETVTVRNQKRFPSRKKQNMVEKLIQEAVEEMNVMEDVQETDPERIEVATETAEQIEQMEDSRLGAERSLKRTGRQGWRGSHRYNSQ